MKYPGYLVEITDGDGSRTVIERDAAHRATAIVGPDNARTTLTMDAAGYLRGMTTPANQGWSMDYTPDGLLTRFQNPLGDASTMLWYPDGKLRSDTNAENGGWTLQRLDWQSRRAWRTTLTSAEGRSTEHTTNDTETGGRYRHTFRPGVGSTERVANQRMVQATRAANGLLVTRRSSADPRFGLAAAIPESIETFYPSSGRRIVRTLRRSAVPVPGGGGALGQLDLADEITVSSNGNARVFQVNYAATTRTWTYQTPEGRTATVAVDAQGRPLSFAVPGLATVEYTYDSRGRLIEVAAGSGAQRRESQFGYDAGGYLDTLVDAEDRSVLLDRDSVGRVLTQTLPDARQIGFGYDAANRLTRVTPPARPDHGFGYDRIGQLTSYAPPSVAGVPQPDTGYGYNRDRQLTGVTRPDGATVALAYEPASGLLQTMTTPTGPYGYLFARGQLVAVTAPGDLRIGRSHDGPLLTREETIDTALAARRSLVQIGYDDYARLGTLTVSGNTASTPVPMGYAYDDDGLLTSATLAGASLALARDAGNGLLTGTEAGEVADTWSYNAFAEPSSYAATVSGNPVYETAFTRDRLGRITRKVETIGGATATYDYGYDLAGRLDTVTRDGALIADYGYDGNSNRTSAVYAAPLAGQAADCAPAPVAGVVTIAATADTQDRLLSYGTCSYTYTANGELTGKTNSATSETTGYAYDVLGNLREIELPDGRTVTYRIDGFNRRVGKSIDGVPVQGLVYAGQLEPVAELDGAGNVVATFLYAERGHVPSLMRKGGATYRIIADHLGSVRLVIDVATGQIAQRLDYDAFGAVLLDTNPGFQPFGYAGGLYDRDTGLTRFGARDYDPAIGRWTAKDPIRFAGGDSNLYAYVGGNPISNIDPFGLRALNDCEKSLLSPYIPQVDLDNADIHDGEVPWYLPDDMAGITRGNDIYFRPGVYEQGTVAGVALLAHELVHVGQYRNGMTWYKYLWSTRKGYSRNSKYEKPAYDLEDKVTKELTAAGTDCGCGK
jgi:RHS repeat-associated protein